MEHESERLSEMHAWIRAALAEQAIRLTGEIEPVRQRPWSIILRVPTSAGFYYFKASPNLSTHEAGITDALSKWSPDCIVQVAAVDASRDWLLMRDSGEPIRELIRSTRDISPWKQILPRFARLQIEMVPHVGELLALGAPDRRLAVLPTQYDQLLTRTEILRVDQPFGLSSEELLALRAMSPQFAAWCAQLAAAPIPESLHNSDFNNSNVYLRDGQARFADWGESNIAHPFFSMRAFLVSTEFALELPDNALELIPLRDAYLQAWTRFAPLEELRAIFKLAHRLSMVCSALNWYQTVSSLPAAEREQEEFAVPVPSLLQEFLHADQIAAAFYEASAE